MTIIIAILLVVIIAATILYDLARPREETELRHQERVYLSAVTIFFTTGVILLLLYILTHYTL